MLSPKSYSIGLWCSADKSLFWMSSVSVANLANMKVVSGYTFVPIWLSEYRNNGPRGKGNFPGFPKNLMLGEGKGASQRGNVAPRKRLQVALPTFPHLIGGTEAQTRMNQWWAGPYLDQDLLNMHVSSPLLKL